jgi:hypothetical protein
MQEGLNPNKNLPLRGRLSFRLTKLPIAQTFPCTSRQFYPSGMIFEVSSRLEFIKFCEVNSQSQTTSSDFSKQNL